MNILCGLPGHVCTNRTPARPHARLPAASLLGSGLDAKARAAEGASPAVLRDCVLLKPGSDTEDLFEVRVRVRALMPGSGVGWGADDN